MILWLFDIDGTLLHAGGSGRASFDAVMLAHHGVRDACAGLSFGGKTDPALVDEVFVARLGRKATDGERAAFLAAYVDELRARVRCEVIDGVHEALAYVRARGDVVGIATGNIRAGADIKLAAANLSGFTVGGYGCDSHLRAELVKAAITRAGKASAGPDGAQRCAGSIERVVVIGDTVHDIAAARANGAVAVAVATGGQSAADLAGADCVLASLRELATSGAASR